MPTNKHWPQGRVSFTGMARSHKDFRLPLDSFFPLRCSNFMQKKHLRVPAACLLQYPTSLIRCS